MVHSSAQYLGMRWWWCHISVLNQVIFAGHETPFYIQRKNLREQDQHDRAPSQDQMAMSFEHFVLRPKKLPQGNGNKSKHRLIWRKVPFPIYPDVTTIKVSWLLLKSINASVINDRLMAHKIYFIYKIPEWKAEKDTFPQIKCR